MNEKRRAPESKAAKAERIKTDLLELCRDFIEEQGITCAEAVHQSDRVIENAYEFIGQICELVGYHEDPDE